MILTIIFFIFLLPYCLQSMEPHNTPPKLIQTELMNGVCGYFHTMLRSNVAGIISDEEVLATNENASAYTPQEMQKHKLFLIKKSGLRKRFNDNYTALSTTLANLWDKALDDPAHTVQTSQFLKKVDKIDKKNRTMSLSEEERKLFLLSSYSLRNFSDVVIPLILKKSNFNCLPHDFLNLMKDFFVQYATLRYGNSSENRILSWCPCPKAQLGDRLGVTVKIVHELTQRFCPQLCTESTPLYYSSFGSGDLLNDYLILYILYYAGYQFFL
jgi:hypothetical protein